MFDKAYTVDWWHAREDLNRIREASAKGRKAGEQHRNRKPLEAMIR